MHAPVHEETCRGHTIKIHHDTDPQNPRDRENLGTMVCGHRRYNLGDTHAFSDARDFLTDLCNYSGDTGLSTQRLIEIAQTKAVLLPVYLYDHSGLAMNTTGFDGHPHGAWDSAQVGFIHVRLDDVRKQYGVSRVSADLRDRVADCLRAEVFAYHNYLAGNVFGFTIEIDGEEIDSCWGFAGDCKGDCLAEARAAVQRQVSSSSRRRFTLPAPGPLEGETGREG